MNENHSYNKFHIPYIGTSLSKAKNIRTLNSWRSSHSNYIWNLMKVKIISMIGMKAILLKFISNSTQNRMIFKLKDKTNPIRFFWTWEKYMHLTAFKFFQVGSLFLRVFSGFSFSMQTTLKFCDYKCNLLFTIFSIVTFTHIIHSIFLKIDEFAVFKDELPN